MRLVVALALGGVFIGALFVCIREFVSYHRDTPSRRALRELERDFERRRG